MLRIAIQGNLSEGAKYIDLIRNNSDCILSGLCTEINIQLTEQDKLIDHPVPIFDNIKDLPELSVYCYNTFLSSFEPCSARMFVFT